MHSQSTVTTSTSQHGRIAGLDGLRGVAVALVLGFHLYPRLVPGGWLGVSLFFTLSGFLITTVILRDLDNNSFTFKSFYARRARRLLPAALLVLALFTLSWTLLGWFDTNHRNDVFFAFLQIANWQQIWEGIPYGTALASPVVHYWSLAIEEQAYLVLPLLIVVFGAKRLRLVAPFLFILSVGATFLAHQNQSLIYFGTHTRAAEILAGVIVAIVMHNTSRTPKSHISTVVSATGLIYLITASTIVHLNDNIVYQGGLIITGVVSAAVIATVPFSPIATVLNLAPLVWLGTVSYGIYLIHWPVLLTLKQTDLPQWAISPLTLVATLGLATLMHRYYETPIRTKSTNRKLFIVTTALLVMFFTSFKFAKTPILTFEKITDRITSQNSGNESKIPIFLLGDSRALTFGLGVNKYLNSPKGLQESLFEIHQTFIDLGCPIGRGGRIRTEYGIFNVSQKCDWTEIVDVKSAVAIIWAGQADSLPRDPLGIEGDEFFTLADEKYRQWLKKEYQSLFSLLKKNGQIKLIGLVSHNPISNDEFPVAYNRFLNELKNENEIIIFELDDFISTEDIQDYFPDERHLSFGEPIEYSPTNDNSAADLYLRWFEPQLCEAVRESTNLLSRDTQCPTIDYSPRNS